MKSMITLFLLLISAASVASAGEPPQVVQCNACHGLNGAAPIMETYPKINGQNKAYLVSALKDYRDGKRAGALSAAMSAQAAQLSDDEIDALATYYSQQ